MMEKITIVAILTSVTTEAAKKILNGLSIKYSSDVLAGLLSIFFSVIIEIYLVNVNGSEIGFRTLSEGVSLVFLSFLGATLGYDKAIEALSQLSQHKLD